MTHLLVSSGPSMYLHQVCNRLLSRNRLMFSTLTQIPIIEECLGFDGLEGRNCWREFEGGHYGANRLLLDVLNDSVVVDSVVLMPSFSQNIPLDILTAEVFASHYEENVLSMLHVVLFLESHDRLKPGANISLLKAALPERVEYAAYHSSFIALKGALQTMKKTTDLFSTCDYRVHLPPVNPKPEIEDDYVEHIAQLLER